MQSFDTKQFGQTIHPCVLELREMLRSLLGGDFVRLYHYGSRVEGGADPESDYDVLCITRKPLNRKQREDIVDRQMDIQMTHSIVFDLHFREEGQLNSASPVYTPYVDQVISEGIVV